MSRYSEQIKLRRKQFDADWEQERKTPKVIENKPWIAIYEEAIASKCWIYDPQIKRWQTPEEFKQNESIISGGEPNRLSKLQVRNPLEGIEAAYQQLQSLKDRMEIFMNRVITYYQKTP